MSYELVMMMGLFISALPLQHTPQFKYSQKEIRLRTSYVKSVDL